MAQEHLDDAQARAERVEPRIAAPALVEFPVAPTSAAAWVAWAQTARRDPILELRGAAEHASLVELELHLTFGSLDLGWTEGPIEVPAATTLPYTLVLPPEAWLDPLCGSYVSRLAVRVSGGSPPGLPMVYVGWPAGQAAGPMVWTEAEVRSYAPFGLTNSSLIAAVSSEAEPPDWVEPPLPALGDHERVPDVDRTILPTAQPEPDGK